MNIDPLLVWFLIGLVLVLSEFMLPGIILVFFGLGAWITCLTTWAGLTDGLAGQLLVFAVSSILLLVLLRRWFRARFLGHKAGEQDPFANLDDFTGETVTVIEDVSAAGGRVEFKGAAWSARSASEIPAGTRATVVAVEGITLVVEPSGQRSQGGPPRGPEEE
jgi:membrane protein implicated in regulation of membrane protease activity